MLLRVLTAGALLGSHSEDQRKIPFYFQQGEWKEDVLKNAQSILVCFKRAFP